MKRPTYLGNGVSVKPSDSSGCILTDIKDGSFHRIELSPDTLAAFLKWLQTQPGSGAKVAGKERAK